MNPEASSPLFITNSVQETVELGRRIALELRPGAVVAMDGPLGSGKTVLVRGMVEALGGNTALVGSPTFGLVHEYPIGGNHRLVHMDCYRMSGAEDLESVGWFGFAGAADSITVIEWADRIASALPDELVTIFAGHQSQNSRIFEISGLSLQADSSSSSSGEMP